MIDEMELLTQMRAEVPSGPPSPGAAARFADGLARTGQLDRKPRVWSSFRSDQARPGHRRRGWRLAAAGTAAAALAAAAVVTMLPSASRPAKPAGGQITATELAYRAAAAAAAQPNIRPGQWIYRALYRGETRDYQGHIVLYSVTVGDWATADDRLSAFYRNGSHDRLIFQHWAGWASEGCGNQPAAMSSPGLCVPEQNSRQAVPFISYAHLAQLPTGPQALISAAAALDPHGLVWISGEGLTQLGSPRPGAASPTKARSFRAFEVITTLLTEYTMGPQRTSELYRALGQIPGIAVNYAARDAAGRRGLGFTLLGPARAYIQGELIINPRTYQLLGIGLQHQFGSTAILRQQLVSGPGVQPGQQAAS